MMLTEEQLKILRTCCRDEAAFEDAVKLLNDASKAPSKNKSTIDTSAFFFAKNPQPIAIYDLETLQFLAVNDALVALYGYSEAEFLSMTIKDIRPLEDVPVPLKCLQNLADTQGDANPQVRGRWRHIRKDGSLITVETTSYKIEFAGKRARIISVFDITEQDIAKKRLQSTENFLRAIYEESTASMFVVDVMPDGSFVFAGMNPQHERYSGLHQVEIIGLTPHDVFPPAEATELVRHYSDCVKAAETISYEACLVFHGRETWMRTTITPLWDERKRIYRILGTSIDLTENKRDLQLLEMQKYVMEMLALGKPQLEIMNVICQLTERQTKNAKCAILLLNPETQTLHYEAAPSLHEEYIEVTNGIRIGPCIGSCGTAAYLKKLIVAENIETDPLWTDYKEAALKHGLKSAWSSPIIDASGYVLGTFAVYHTHPYKPNEKDIQIMEAMTILAAVVIDRKNADKALNFEQTRYQGLFNNLSDGVYRSTPEGKFLEVNPALVKMFGYSSKEDIMAIDIPTQLYFSESDRQPALSRNGVVIERLKRKDGSEIWVEENVQLVTDADGKPLFYDGIIRDLTGRLKLDEQLKLLASAVHNATDSILITDATTRKDGGPKIIFINEAFTKLTGYVLKDVIGKTPRILQGPRTIRETLNRIREAIRTWQPIREEVINYRKDGTEYWAELVITPVADEAGWFTHWVSVQRDITDRKAAEEQLRFQAHVMEQVQEAVIAFDMTETITFWNAGAEKRYDYTKSEAIGQKMFQLINWGHVNPDEEKNSLETLESTGVWQGEVQHTKKNGQTFYASLSITLLKGVKGTPVGYMAVIQDITERKAAEIKIQESEKRFKALVQNASDITAILDEAGIVRYSSPSAEQVLGFKPEEIMGKNGFEFIHPQDRAMVQEAFANLILVTGQTISLQYRYYTASGKYIYLEVKATNLLDEPSVKGIVVNARDITERLVAEGELKNNKVLLEEVYNRTETAVLLIDPNTNTIMDCNARAVELFEAAAKENLIGLYKGLLRVEPEPLDLALAMQKELEGRDFFKDEHEYKSFNGRVFWGYRTMRRIQVSGKPIIIVRITDITERKEAEYEKEMLKMQLIQSQKMEAVGTLAGGIAHDFNNLLTGILGNAGLLKMSLKHDDAALKRVERIEDASNRAATLTKQILGFSRKGKLNVKPTFLNDRVRSVLTLTEHTIDRRIQIVTDLQRDLPPIEGDESQIEQVLLNLTVNAADAMTRVLDSKGNGQLRFQTQFIDADEFLPIGIPKSETPTAYVHLAVSDTGIGMSEDIRERIYEPFFTTKEIGKGTGLGLSMVYGIVKNHNGYIFVESQLGIGTTFHLYFPVSSSGHQTNILKQADMIEQGKGTILVIDDEEAIRELVCEVLDAAGYRILQARNGQEGVTIFRQHQDDIGVVILDVNMPVMGGAEALQNLRQLKPNVKVLIATGHADEATASQLVKQGVSGILNKPYTLAELSKKVAAVFKDNIGD
jgi:two-component system cell cycle sensor histidine kinase/response regulator CckA